MHSYAYWRSLLAREGGEIALSPQPGFYRRRMGKGGAWRPIAIWPEGDDLRCLDAERDIDPLLIWDQCWATATTEEAYRAKIAGTPYADEFLVRGSSECTTDVAKAAPIGPRNRRTDNGSPEESPARG